MSDERPYAERPAARPDPNLIAARDADAAGGAGKPGSGPTPFGDGCVWIFLGILGILLAIFLFAVIFS
jgi:hypothetical protein